VNCGTFTLDLHCTQGFRMKKAETVQISQLAGLSTTGHIVTHSAETEQTQADQICDSLQGNESCDSTSHA
jgi:hypothetical protein